MTQEINEKLELFLDNHAQILVEWLTLVQLRRNHHVWEPRRGAPNYDYRMGLFKLSIKHNNAASNFEESVDKNILLTYLKYHNENGEQIIYPFTFNYKEPSIDMVLCQDIKK